MFAQEAPHSPALKRALVFTSCGGFFPVLATIVVMIGAGVYNLITGETPLSWESVPPIIHGTLVLGQISAWTGLTYWCRTGLWDGRVIFVLWLSGGASAMAEAFAWTFVLVPIPLLMPLVGTAIAIRARRQAATQQRRTA